MSDEKPHIPEGMEAYTRMGVNVVGPAGMPPDFVNAVFQSLVQAGALVFDPENETLTANPDMTDDKVRGLVMKMDNNMDVKDVRMLSDDEVNKDIGGRKL